MDDHDQPKTVSIRMLKSINDSISSLKIAREIAVTHDDNAGQSEYSYRLAKLQTDLDRYSV